MREIQFQTGAQAFKKVALNTLSHTSDNDTNHKANSNKRARPVAPVSADLPAASLLSVAALATLIGWHPESVRRAIRQGRIHALKLGRGWRIPCQALAEILEAGIPRIIS